MFRFGANNKLNTHIKRRIVKESRENEEEEDEETHAAKREKIELKSTAIKANDI